MNLERFYPLAVFFFAFLLYANTIPNDYNLDDELVTINHRTTSKGLEGISEIFTGFYYEDEMGYKHDYRPITHLSFAFEHQFFGEDPHISHFINVFLYALLCLLIFYLGNKLNSDKTPFFGLLIALVFAILPIHTEVVASIKNRDEILSLLFGLASFYILFYIDKKLILSILLSIFLFQLSIFSKPSTVLFIIIIPFYFLIIKKESKSWVFFLYGIVNAFLFSYFFIENLISAIAFNLVIILFFLLYYLLFKIDIKQQIIIFFKSNLIFYSLLVLAYGFLAISLLFGGSIFILVAVSVSTSILVLANFKNLKILQMYILIYPIISLFTYYFNTPTLLFSYLILFAISNSIITKQQTTYCLLYFAALGTLAIIDYPGLIVVLILPIIFLYFKKYFKYLLVVMTILITVVNIDFPSFFFLNASLLLLILNEMFTIKQLKGVAYKSFFKYFPLFFINLVLIHYQVNYSHYERLPSKENYEDLVNTITEEEKYLYLNDIDRPLLFAENPVVEKWNIKNRLIAGVNTISFYFKKMVFPYPLLFYYGYNQIDILDAKSVNFFVSIFILLSIIALTVISFCKKQFLLSFSLLFIVLNLVPYLNIFVPIAGIVGERLAFTSSFGLSILLVIVLLKVMKIKKLKVASQIGFVLIVTASILLVFNRNLQWKNKQSLFLTDAPKLKNSSVANSIIGSYYLNETKKLPGNSKLKDDKINKAITYYNKAISIYPGFYNSFYELGIAYYLKGDFFKAQKSFEKSYALDSTYLAEPYYNMALWAVDLRQDSIAIYNYVNYINLNPFDEQAHFELLKIYLNNKQNRQAVYLLENMIGKFPNQLLIYYNLYEINRVQGRDSLVNYYYNVGLQIDSLQFKAYINN